LEWVKDGFTVSDDKSRLDLNLIHHFLSTESYWAKGRTLETVKESVQNCICFGLFNQNHEQIGFARVLTDYCISAGLYDVFIVERFRKSGLGHFLLKCIFDHPKLKSVKWVLKTTYSRTLYQDFGFKEVEALSGWMSRDRFESRS